MKKRLAHACKALDYLVEIGFRVNFRIHIYTTNIKTVVNCDPFTVKQVKLRLRTVNII